MAQPRSLNDCLLEIAAMFPDPEGTEANGDPCKLVWPCTFCDGRASKKFVQAVEEKIKGWVKSQRKAS